MIVFIITIQIILSTATQDITNIRYNSLLSAQCKARCLYEYRNYHQQRRSLPSMFIDEKSKRLVVNFKQSFFFLIFKVCAVTLLINLFDKQKIENVCSNRKNKMKGVIQVLPILIYSRQCFC